MIQLYPNILRVIIQLDKMQHLLLYGPIKLKIELKSQFIHIFVAEKFDN